MQQPAPLRVRLPTRAPGRPLVAIAKRFAFAGVLVLLNWGLVLVERGGYTDNADGHVSVVDALYYTTVTLSTTGYGDITPVTTSARLVNALVVTPMRLLFVVVLVGTTISALTERSRQELRLSRWRSRVDRHVVVLGYGTKGRNAVRALLLQGHPREQVVVVDADERATASAAADGLVAVVGSATDRRALAEALVERAATVVVALGADDTAVLASLAVRRQAPQVTVVAAAREADNAELLRQSGASSVIVSSETTGRLLGLATGSPAAVDVVEDLLSFGTGLDVLDRGVAPDEVGRAASSLGVPVLAVVRGGRTLLYDDPQAATLQDGDRVVVLRTSGTGG
ncbi:voltage-gated potassium channel [Motilibacter rhizosphaerae]|uniref:Voltage-gated potassium channel n=1 Tax=Motilibacter rhizosphaerae TaxID=598652 RepID=A0A4Q7NW12_9ACTN|nr:NAD-binding protein [Motilibacter rhizosphaerae]RZS91190.1 voltage-gated potassium channel [Motilibacter rhizosphaerae]